MLHIGKTFGPVKYAFGATTDCELMEGPMAWRKTRDLTFLYQITVSRTIESGFGYLVEHVRNIYLLTYGRYLLNTLIRKI